MRAGVVLLCLAPACAWVGGPTGSRGRVSALFGVSESRAAARARKEAEAEAARAAAESVTAEAARKKSDNLWGLLRPAQKDKRADAAVEAVEAEAPPRPKPRPRRRQRPSRERAIEERVASETEDTAAKPRAKTAWPEGNTADDFFSSIFGASGETAAPDATDKTDGASADTDLPTKAQRSPDGDASSSPATLAERAAAVVAAVAETADVASEKEQVALIPPWKGGEPRVLLRYKDSDSLGEDARTLEIVIRAYDPAEHATSIQVIRRSIARSEGWGDPRRVTIIGAK